MFAVIKMELSGKSVYGPVLKTTHLSAHAQNHASPERCRKSLAYICADPEASLQHQNTEGCKTKSCNAFLVHRFIIVHYATKAANMHTRLHVREHNKKFKTKLKNIYGLPIT